MHHKFDSYVAIDWSGASSLYSPSIAIAEITHQSEKIELIRPTNHHLWSRTSVYEWILNKSQQGKRIFVGIDANFSYAHNVIKKQFPKTENAFEFWHHIELLCQNTENFYAHNIWQHPQLKEYFWTSGKMPENFFFHQRYTEHECITQKIGSPENPFKLIGAKQVGKGGLAVMRMLHKLRKNLGEDVAIWPFDTKDKINSSPLVCAEIYPRLFIQKSGFGQKKIRTNDELKNILSMYDASFISENAFSDHESDALISAAGIKNLFRKQYPFSLHHDNKIISDFEGWILGV
jgi:hypothetical protein